MNQDKEFLGNGIAFPLGLNAHGHLQLVTGYTDIEQSIQIILGTIPGERVMRPEFGCRAWELVFAPNNAATHALLQFYIEQALEMWEPRIELQDVQMQLDANGNTIWVDIFYEIKDTHDVRSIVYPFYIMDEG